MIKKKKNQENPQMGQNMLIQNQNFPGPNNLNQIMGMGLQNQAQKKPVNNIQDNSQQEKVNFLFIIRLENNYF